MLQSFDVDKDNDLSELEFLHREIAGCPSMGQTGGSYHKSMRSSDVTSRAPVWEFLRGDFA